MLLPAGFTSTTSGLFMDVGVDVRVVLALEGGPDGRKGCAEIEAHVMAGVLELEVVPVVPFDSTREIAGSDAVTACRGPLGTAGTAASLVVLNNPSNFVLLICSLSVAISFSKGTASSSVMWFNTVGSLMVSSRVGAYLLSQPRMI